MQFARIVTALAVSASLLLPGVPAHAALPGYDHIVVVVEENHAFGKVIGNGRAPYLSALAVDGATMTGSFAVGHPSQPNYLALFSGSTQGLTDDSCPHVFDADNLGHQVLAAGLSFAGYAEDMPADGYTGCAAGGYARKHNPWVHFPTVPPASNLRFDDFPADFTRLPSVAFVVPDLCDDMHDCPVPVGDAWLREHLGGYARWAGTHNSLLVVTFDEDDHTADNQIPTLFYGAHVKTGQYPEHITHYTVLRTLQSLRGLGCTADSCAATAITDIWN